MFHRDVTYLFSISPVLLPFAEMTDYIIDEKGEEVISERHQKDYKKEDYNSETEAHTSPESFTDVNFEDI